MCQKNGVRRFWLVVKTAAELHSPLPIVTVQHQHHAEAIQQVAQNLLDKNLRFHIFDSLHDRPMVHVLPIHIPLEELR